MNLRVRVYTIAQRLVARHRRNVMISKVARATERFRVWHRNLDGDPHHNGERRVVQILGGFDLTTIFDVGANVGDWCQMARVAIPHAKVHAFEIAGPTGIPLADRFRSDPNVVVNQFGLGEAEGEVEINYYPDDNTLSTLMAYPHAKAVTVVSARVVSGDAYVELNGLEQVDYVKLDVEGAEHLVLAGFSNMITEGRIGAVQFEYGTVNIVTKFLLRDFYDLFRAANFSVGKIYPTYVDFREYSFDQEDFLGQNYLAVSNARREWIAALS